MKLTSTVFLDFVRHIIEIQDTSDDDTAQVIVTLCKETEIIPVNDKEEGAK